MAVNLQTLEGVAEVVSKGRYAVDMFMMLSNLDTDNLVDQAISHIQDRIKDLSKAESEFLSMFDCHSTEQFKQRVLNYYNYQGLISFTGSSLRQIIEDFKTASDEQVRKRAETIELMINNLIRSDLVKDFNEKFEGDIVEIFKNKEVTNDVAEYVAHKLIGALSNKTLGNGGILTSIKFSGVQKAPNGKGAFEIAANNTTSAFNDHLADLQKLVDAKLTGLTKDSDEYEAIKTARILLKPIKGKKQISELSMTQSFGFTWSNIITEATKGKTGKGSDINISDAELTRVNKKITDMILQQLNLDSSMQTFARGRITDMYTKDPKMFFVGSSTTQVEGILGEINAVIAIVGLLGEKYRPRAIKWIGSQPGVYSKKQPSIDIVLREIGGIQFGVQVKNTADELLPDIAHYIHFADKPLDEIFDKFGGSEDIKDVYISDTYNVPYKRIGMSYKQVGYGTSFKHNDPAAPRFSIYVELDKQIDEIVQTMNLYFTRFAPDFLYMGLGDNFRSDLATLDNKVITTGGNFVYIVGPKVYFAKEMLQQLEQELRNLQELKSQEEQMSIKFETYFDKVKGEKEAFNIVSDLNGGGDGLSSHKIKMRSSWGFK